MSSFNAVSEILQSDNWRKQLYAWTDKEKPGVGTIFEEKTQGITPKYAQDKHLKLITRQEVSNHCDALSCWVILSDKVYDLTEFVKEHPGGEDIILENAGRDVTYTFKDVGHSKDAFKLLEKYLIGILVEGDQIKRKRFESC